MAKNIKRKSVAQRLIESVTEVAEAFESGKPLETLLTVRKVQMAEPGEYDARRVAATRERLHVSQAVFASIIGASAGLVRAWEIGTREPNRMARRLLDEVNRDPNRWLRLAVASIRKESAGKPSAKPVRRRRATAGV